MCAWVKYRALRHDDVAYRVAIMQALKKRGAMLGVIGPFCAASLIIECQTLQPQDCTKLSGDLALNMVQDETSMVSLRLETTVYGIIIRTRAIVSIMVSEVPVFWMSFLTVGRVPLILRQLCGAGRGRIGL